MTDDARTLMFAALDCLGDLGGSAADQLDPYGADDSETEGSWGR